MDKFSWIVKRGGQKTDVVECPKMPFSAVCFALGLPNTDCSSPPGAARSLSLFPAGEKERLSVCRPEMLGLISRWM